mmetsp:Transcript_109086/g.303379  ORF Transcript_109086/g.303379 Transcript_109086/m.303379 type:complete len:219 (+) Transcript_109086:675-1331(+)
MAGAVPSPADAPGGRRRVTLPRTRARARPALSTMWPYLPPPQARPCHEDVAKPEARDVSQSGVPVPTEALRKLRHAQHAAGSWRQVPPGSTSWSTPRQCWLRCGSHQSATNPPAAGRGRRGTLPRGRPPPAGRRSDGRRRPCEGRGRPWLRPRDCRNRCLWPPAASPTLRSRPSPRCSAAATAPPRGSCARPPRAGGGRLPRRRQRAPRPPTPRRCGP